MNDVPEDINQLMLDLEYMERYHLTAEQYQDEPWEKIWLSHLKWKYEAERRAFEAKQSG